MNRVIRFILVLLAAGPGQACGAGPEGGPFADAALAPESVSMYLHVQDAAGLRAALADRPVGTWLSGMLERSAAGDAWNALARRSGISDAALFDRLLGRRFTLLARHADNADAAQWTMMTIVPVETMQALRQSWRLQQQLPQHGFAISTLPEQDLMFAEEGEVVFIGPRSAPELMEDVLRRYGRQRERSLAGRADVGRRLRAAERGQVGLFVEHDQALGGWSVITADLRGDEVTLHQAARFERPPFRRGITESRCDFSRLRAFEQKQLLTVMEPTDIGESQIETYIAQVVGEGLTSRPMRKALGDRRIIAIGEEEGRLRDVPEDVLAPVPAICLEVDGDAYTVRQLDHQMTRLATRLNELQQGPMVISIPPVRAYEHGHDRHIDIAPAAEWFTGGFPIMKTVTLNWDVARGPDGTWAVIAASPAQLKSVVESLKCDSPADERLAGVLDNVGSINGLRLGRQLSSWAERADVLAEPGQEAEFEQVVGVLAELAEGVDRVTWQMRRPTRDRMCLDVQIRLGDHPSE